MTLFYGVDGVFCQGVEVGEESISVFSITEVFNAVVNEVSVSVRRFGVGLQGSSLRLCYSNLLYEFNNKR